LQSERKEQRQSLVSGLILLKNVHFSGVSARNRAIAYFTRVGNLSDEMISILFVLFVSIYLLGLSRAAAVTP